jgi:hypothetical protein
MITLMLLSSQLALVDMLEIFMFSQCYIISESYAALYCTVCQLFKLLLHFAIENFTEILPLYIIEAAHRQSGGESCIY